MNRKEEEIKKKLLELETSDPRKNHQVSWLPTKNRLR